MKSFVLIVICNLLCIANTWSQIEIYSKENGLSSNTITTTFVDSRGIVWIGTTNGLNAIIKSELIDLSQIQNNATEKYKSLKRIETIYEDRRGNLWISTSVGLFLYNRKFWVDFEYPEEEDYIVTRIMEDRRNWIWFTHEETHDVKVELGYSFASGSVQMFDRQLWYVYDDEAAASGYSRLRTLTGVYTSMLQDRQGDLWLGSYDGLKHFKNGKWASLGMDAIGGDICFQVIEDHNGVIWAATEFGVANWKNEEWTIFDDDDSLPKAETYDLQLGPSGDIWGFHRTETKFIGLSFYNGTEWKSFGSDDYKLKGNIEKLVWIDSSSVIAFSKNGVSIYEQGGWKPQGKKQGLSDEKFSLIEKDRKNNIWLAGQESLYLFQNNKWTKLYDSGGGWEITELIVDKKGWLWLASEKSGAFLFDNKNWKNYNISSGLPDNHITEIFEDKEGAIWLVTRKGAAKIRVQE